MPSARKVAIVNKLTEKAQKAKALVFTNYQGLTHKQIEALKKALRGLDSEFVVTKNTLLKLALGMNKIPDSNFDGPTATLFAYGDFINPLKELAKSIKLFKLPNIKFAVVEGKLLEAEDVLKLAMLPTREVLIGQVIGSLKGPLYGLHRSLNWNLQKLVVTLKAIESKKQ